MELATMDQATSEKLLSQNYCWLHGLYFVNIKFNYYWIVHLRDPFSFIDYNRLKFF